MPDSQAEALLAERDGYVARGLTGRVAEVDAALAALNVVVDDTAPSLVIVIEGQPVDLAQLEKDDLLALATVLELDANPRSGVKKLREALADHAAALVELAEATA